LQRNKSASIVENHPQPGSKLAFLPANIGGYAAETGYFGAAESETVGCQLSVKAAGRPSENPAADQF
jgi:hypothetical protein